MPTLDWIGKDKVVNHHLDVPYRVLERVYSYDETGQHDADNGSRNMIIHGDNLEALKALLPQYEGRIKCIYIDPPYNTGNEGWVYNDNVNDPRMVAWVDKVVGSEGEDLSRHDKWLCMMYPRLRLLQKLLAEDGAILISIDDNELYSLKAICDEIFGLSNYVGTCVWQGSKKGDSKLISVNHEYILVYVANKRRLVEKRTLWRRRKQGLDEIFAHYDLLRNKYGSDHVTIQNEMKRWYRSLPADSPSRAQKHYCFSDDRGLYFPDNFAGPNDGRDSRPRYDIIHPVTGKPCKKPSTGWRWDEEHTKAALAENPPRIHFGPTEETIPCRKSYLKDVSMEPLHSVFYKDGRGSSKLVDALLGKDAFEFPKDPDVLAEFIGMITDNSDVILDSFAGSGSTAHAILKLNKSGGNRKFILVELMDYADTITAERVKRVIKGYGEGKSAVPGLPGDFSFYELGMPLFIDGFLNPDAPLDTIRTYIYYSETRTAAVTNDPDDPYLLGVDNGTAIYFCYEPNSLVILDHGLLASLKAQAGSYLIYADINGLDDGEMRRHSIRFKKIPRDIARI